MRTALRDLVAPQRPVLSATALAAVTDFTLEGVLDRTPGELSFAQRRLVGIARSVARGPSVPLLDEPGAGLDAHEIRELAVLVRSLADDWAWRSCSSNTTWRWSPRPATGSSCSAAGKVLSAGSPQDMLADEQVRAAYTGAPVA